jgi:hypothetical protein
VDTSSIHPAPGPASEYPAKKEGGGRWILEVSTPGPRGWAAGKSLGEFSRNGWWIFEKSTSPIILKKQYSCGGWILGCVKSFSYYYFLFRHDAAGHEVSTHPNYTVF